MSRDNIIIDKEAINFCGEVYLFREKPDCFVLERGAAISITFLRLPGENRRRFMSRLRLHEKEIETRYCTTCVGLCKTTTSVCRLYKKNKLAESED